MKRKAFDLIREWGLRPNRKPLILNGARQVGKTWLMMEYANVCHADNYVYVNFDDDPQLRNVFVEDYDINRIITAISIIKNKVIDDSTLLLFDEIQEAPRGVNALKYFYEKTPNRNIIAAGSMLGISMHYGDSFPVGKVDIIDIYPLDFDEFLWSTGNDLLFNVIQDEDWTVLDTVKLKAINLLKTYYFVGGMPEAVNAYLASGSTAYNEVRRVHESLLAAYQMDFSKHAPANEVSRIRIVWQSIISQLAKENKKFIYSALRHGARAKDFETAIDWLLSAGLVYKVERVTLGQLPLRAYANLDIFKLYLLDVGLLGAMGRISAKTLVDGSEIFEIFKGALTEQYVFQQLKVCRNLGVYYWSADNSSGEVDFVVDNGAKVLPIEVKASENLRSKSLASFRTRNHLDESFRFSLADYREQENLINIPLYAVLPYMRSHFLLS